MKTKMSCVECGRSTGRLHPILGVALHQDCQRENKAKYEYITKSRALGNYRLKKADLDKLKSHEVDNPYYKKAAPMQLYLHTQVKEVAKEKWKNA